MSDQWNLINLRRDHALVLVGPQGCGKSTMARGIAEKRGRYSVIEAYQLDGRFGLGAALKSKPDTLIVEGTELSLEAAEVIKRMLSQKAITVHEKGQAPKLAKSPRLIFCSNDAAPLNLESRDRRYLVVHVERQSAKSPTNEVRGRAK